MDRPFTCQVLVTDHEIDVTAGANLEAVVGKVVVEMLPEARQIGLIQLPDNVQGVLRPDVGVVLAVGPGVDDLEPGDMVVVRPYDGTWVEGFECDGYKAKGQVRIYGAYHPYSGESLRCDWSESIPVRIREEQMLAVSNNVIIRRTPLIQQQSGLLLPDAEKYRDCMATVVSIGAKALVDVPGGRVEEGDTIHYDATGVLDFAFKDDPDLAVIKDSDINLRVKK